MVKYVTNCFLATKVSFANEIKQICDKLDIDYDKVVEYSTKDKRLGTSHWAVPGHDGHFGFGLTCFPKDLNALIATATSLGVDPKVMIAVWEKNLEVRPEKDWEKLIGRAITNDKNDKTDK
jgi:UDPglucose 6-dehydrogenase